MKILTRVSAVQIRVGCSRAFNKAKRLLEENKELEKTDPNEKGTALHWAVEGGDEKMVECLLNKGANVNAWDPFLGSALSWAVQNGSTQMVELLLERHADVRAKSTMGLTALHLAAQKGYVQLVHRLLEEGAEIGAKDNVKRTALALAEKSGNVEVAKFLRQKTPDDAIVASARPLPLRTASKSSHGTSKGDSGPISPRKVRFDSPV